MISRIDSLLLRSVAHRPDARGLFPSTLNSNTFELEEKGLRERKLRIVRARFRDRGFRNPGYVPREAAWSLWQHLLGPREETTGMHDRVLGLLLCQSSLSHRGTGWPGIRPPREDGAARCALGTRGARQWLPRVWRSGAQAGSKRGSAGKIVHHPLCAHAHRVVARICSHMPRGIEYKHVVALGQVGANPKRAERTSRLIPSCLRANSR
jgi:hypothetical protein